MATIFVFTLASSTSLDAFFHFQDESYDASGQWTAWLETPGGKLAFGLNIEQTDSDGWVCFLVNGNERIKVPTTSFDGKTLTLNIAHYDSKIVLDMTDKQSAQGTWSKVRGKDNVPTLVCQAKKKPRQARLGDASSDKPLGFDGRWKVKFESSEDPAVGVFSVEEDGKAVGTFLTTTGDYRFLAGRAVDKTLELSCFDGAHAFLFRAKLGIDGALTGDFWSGGHWHETWTATPDHEAALADSFAQTKVIAASALEGLTFPDLDGVPTRLGDAKFAAPVRIYHIFGSWCPNCHDAAVFLADLEEKYGDKVSVVGLAFELTGDFTRDAKQVRGYLKRHGLNHTVLIAGVSDKKIASQAIPALDKVRSYPTSLFVDPRGKVIAVHTGFAGPATGGANVKMKQKYYEIIDGMLKKKTGK